MLSENVYNLTFRSFSQGFNRSLPQRFATDDAPHGNRQPLTELAWTLKGVYNDRGNLRHIGKYEQFISTTRECVYFAPFYRMVEDAIDTDNEVRQYIVARESSTPGVFEWVAIDIDEITTTAIGGAWPQPYYNDAVQFGRQIIFTGLTTLQTWYGESGSAKDVGVSLGNFDGDYIIPADGGAGVLDNTGYPSYYYLFALKDRWGNISKPSAVGTAIDVIDKQIRLDFSGTYISGDIANKTVLIYRLGGRNGEYRLAKEFTPALSGGGALWDAATSAPPVDNTPDELLPDVFPAEGRDTPPRGLRTLAVHQGRVFGAGFPAQDADIAVWETPSRLWFSRVNEPEAWGYDDNGVDDDGGFIDVDNDQSDPILDMESMGSLLIVGRSKSVYALYGNGFNTFRFDKRSEVGVANRRSMCRVGNRVAYLGADRRLYIVGDEDNTRISLPIESRMESLTTTEVTLTVVFSHQKRVYISTPLSAGGSQTYCYDTNLGCWTDLSYTEFRVNYAASISPLGSVDTLASVAEKNTLYLVPKGGTTIQKITDGAAYDWSIDVETYIYRPGDFEKDRIISHTLEGDFSGATTALTLTLTAGANSKAYSAIGNTAQYVGSFSRRSPSFLVGATIKARITGTLNSGSIDRLSLGLMRIRSARSGSS